MSRGQAIPTWVADLIFHKYILFRDFDNFHILDALLHISTGSVNCNGQKIHAYLSLSTVITGNSSAPIRPLRQGHVNCWSWIYKRVVIFRLMCGGTW